jgi:hypothetical protein
MYSCVSVEAALFTTEWFKAEVLPDRLQVSTHLPPYYPLLRDLATGILSVLDSATATALGINFSGHFSQRSAEVWENLGQRLAPRDFWSQLLKKPGLDTISIVENEHVDGDGRTSFIVSPSSRVPHGISVTANEHHDFRPELEVDELSIIAERLTSRWDYAKANFDSFVSRLLAFANEGPADATS